VRMARRARHLAEARTRCEKLLNCREATHCRPSLSPISRGCRETARPSIEEKLKHRVAVSFKDAPLSQVIDDLREANGINIAIDQRALVEDGISLETPVTLTLEQVSLKSALNLILKQASLTYVVKDEVIQVTTESHARGPLRTVTYQVA